MVLVELFHDVGPRRFEGAQKDGAEDARGAAGKPFVHLVDGLERITLGDGGTVDLGDGKARREQGCWRRRKRPRCRTVQAIAALRGAAFDSVDEDVRVDKDGCDVSDFGEFH